MKSIDLKEKEIYTYHFGLNRRVKKVNTIVKWLKPVAVGIIFLAALATLTLAGIIVYNIGLSIGSISPKTWGEVRWYLGFFIFCIAILILVVWIITIIVELLKGLPRIQMSYKWERRFLGFLEFIFIKSWISKSIVWLFRGLYQFFCVLIQMFKNNCPPIVWK